MAHVADYHLKALCLGMLVNRKSMMDRLVTKAKDLFSILNGQNVNAVRALNAR